MQTESTIIELGFQKDERGDYLFKGKHQTFYTETGYDNTFCTVYKLSKEIDNRPFSTNKGYPYRGVIKDCCSKGSLQRAILKFDVPEEQITVFVGGMQVKSQSNNKALER